MSDCLKMASQQPASIRKQTSYPVKYKLKVIAWYKTSGKNKHTMARQFQLDSKRLQEYLENEDRLQENGVGSAKKKRKVHEGGKPLSVDVDKAVLDFVYAPWDGLSLTWTSAGKTSNVRRNWAYLSHSKLPQCGSDAGSTETL